MKCLPHVAYCRIWRWPDVHSHHELKAVSNCEYPFAAKKPEVCINPYHYQRVPLNPLPPIIVPLQSEIASTSSAQSTSPLPTQQTNEVQMPTNATYTTNSYNLTTDGNGTNSPNLRASGQDSPFSSTSESSGFSSTSEASGFSSRSADYQTSFNAHPSYMDDSTFNYNAVNLPSYSYTHQNETVNVNNQQEMVYYEEPPYWATVAYYELNYRVGEAYRCNTNSLIIDGFTNPSANNSNRFSLGQLTNINRTSAIESTRLHIGKGLHLYFVNNELVVECLSSKPIFVQGRMCNYLHQLDLNTVYKIPPTCAAVRIFNNTVFSHLLSQAVTQGYESVFELTKMCTIRISFVKGWGVAYHRQDITTTPCWIEVHLHGPLQWLDKVLMKMNSPLNAISSVS